MLVPTEPKIYHIVHVDRLPSIIDDGELRCDARMAQRGDAGTAIGISSIKNRRLRSTLRSHPGLHVGDCVPFYFCPRSVMLYVIYMRNRPELEYRGGQGPILHLEAHLHSTVAWANANNRRWAFTTSNAGAAYFEDYADLGQLNRLDWDAIGAADWRGRQEGKQAEFLVEASVPWHLISNIGVQGNRIRDKVRQATQGSAHRPPVEVKPDWYY